MTTKILAPHYLRMEREVRADLPSVWRALTDLHELRAWWAVPVVNHKLDVGGGFELRYVGRDRKDKFTYTTWDQNWRIGGRWEYSWLSGAVEEMLIVVKTDEGVRVSIEHSNFESFGPDAGRIFGYHKSETRARLERLQAWVEERIPANLAQMPVV
ncbi:MAG: SRPBCC domain-containing protein [Planctomycetota bacterium]|nr:SRPBCC domain-containing protein [Planctomycetota bacterium]